MARQASRSEEPRRATWADLCAVPDESIAEIIDGELIVSPRPAFPHARTGSVIGVVLGGPFDVGGGGGADAPGGWWFLDEPQLHLGGDDLVPDLAGWRRERVPVLPNVARCEIVPDWVCEILSPSAARTDRMKKMPVYARVGVGHVWLVDPIARTLEAYRLEGGRWVVVGMWGGDVAVRAEPFDAVALDLSRWWLAEGPATSSDAPAAPDTQTP